MHAKYQYPIINAITNTEDMSMVKVLWQTDEWVLMYPDFA